MSAPQLTSLPVSLNGCLSLLDSITDAGSADEGKIVLSGSHGGIYPAAVASQGKVRAVIFNDAGIGIDGAGVRGVDRLADAGMAAAAVDCVSARIGSARDMLESGVISYVNRVAAQKGVALKMTVVEAALLLADIDQPASRLDTVAEARWELSHGDKGVSVLCVDSASLVRPDDTGRIIVTGSHGGLIGGDPSRALKARARLAVFNDAGFGKERIGVSRLPALEAAGVAAVTVSNQTAAIGSAQSCLDSGVISAVNSIAEKMGCRTGDTLSQALQILE